MRAPEPAAGGAAPVDDATTAWARHRPAADRVFRACVAVAAALTIAALWSALGGGGAILGTNRLGVESVAGTWACFLGAFALCAGIAAAHGLPAAWYALALAVAASNTVFELFSPRGTDDVTMVTGNALLCWAFGAIVL